MESINQKIVDAQNDYNDKIKNLLKEKEDLFFQDKKVLYVYNNCVFDDIEILKDKLQLQNVNPEMIKNIKIFKTYLNCDCFYECYLE
jgi:hypothetical protein